MSENCATLKKSLALLSEIDEKMKGNLSHQTPLPSKGFEGVEERIQKLLSGCDGAMEMANRMVLENEKRGNREQVELREVFGGFEESLKEVQKRIRGL